MWEFVLGAAWALWLGIFTSINPCPLATNIAAISYIGRRVGSPRQVFLSGILYTVGRALTYVVLGVLLVGFMLSVPQVSLFLRKYMNKLLGPLLIIVAMFLLNLIQLRFTGGGVSARMQKRVDALGIWGAMLLGIVFALSFCPNSAVIFFLTLIPFAAQQNSSVTLPSVYGVGTGLPVLVFAVLLALSAQSVGKTYNILSQIEWWARRITGAIFLVLGIYFSLKYIFEVI